MKRSGDRQGIVRRWGGLTSIILVTLLALAGAGPQAGAAQTGGLGARYQGTLRIGSVTAPAGTTVILIAPRTATEFTVCGRADTGDNGRYQLDVPATPDCIAPTVEERPTLHLFVVHGENAGFQSNGSSLDNPRSLGRTFRQDLRGTAIPGFDPAAAPADGAMPGVRYYGRATLGATPAPAGTEISVRAELDGVTVEGCGQTTMLDEHGYYWLDVSASPECIAPTFEQRPVHHIFVIDGATVGVATNGASLDEPRSIGQTARRDLRGAAPPTE